MYPLMIRLPRTSTLFPYTTLFRSHQSRAGVVHDRAHVREVEVDQARDRDQVGDALDTLAKHVVRGAEGLQDRGPALDDRQQDRKSTRLNSSHPSISYAVFCLKKKK